MWSMPASWARHPSASVPDTPCYHNTDLSMLRESPLSQTQRDARWYRSMLFVPGHKLDWMLKAPRYGADGLILDLADAVGPAQKPAARDTVARAIAELRDDRCGVFVRVNDWRTGHLLADLLAVVGA